MNEFIKQFSQYFIYKGSTQITRLYQEMREWGLPELLRIRDTLYIRVFSPNDRPDFLLSTNDFTEANEIYERLINFYNENIKEK